MKWLTTWSDGREMVIEASDIRMAQRFAESFYGGRGHRLIGLHQRDDLPRTADAELLGRREK